MHLAGSVREYDDITLEERESGTGRLSVKEDVGRNVVGGCHGDRSDRGRPFSGTLLPR